MAITINIYYRSNNGNAVNFAKEMISLGIVDQIRKKNGNLRYDYYLPIDDLNTLLLIDVWESRTALDTHHNSPIMAEIAALRDKYDLLMEVERYIRDTTDISNNDKQFIR